MASQWLRKLWRSRLVSEPLPARRLAFRPGLEWLECRTVPTITNPLSIGGTTLGSFTDSSGDVVTIRIAGSAGTVNFTDSAANPGVVNGNNIATVAITGASSNFTLTYSLATLVDGVVLMGEITSNKVIRGIYGVPDNAVATTFSLTSFTGVNFSAGGGLAVDTVVGNGTDLGIRLSTGLAANTAINIRGNVDADLFFGTSATHKTQGAILIGGQVLAGGHIEFSGPVTATASLLVQSTYAGTLEANRSFNGAVDIDGAVNGAWDFLGGVGAKAMLQSDDWIDVDVVGNFAGIMNSESTNVNLDVSGNVTGTARINSSSKVTLTVGGSVLAGVAINADNSITLDIGGSVVGAKIVAGSGPFTGTIDGSVKSGAQLIGSSDISLTIGGSVTNSTITGDDDLDLTIDGNVSASTLKAGQSEITLSLAGNLTSSHVLGEITGTIQGNVSGSRFIAGGTKDVTLDISGKLSNTRIETDSEISVNVTGNVTGSTLIASTGGVTLTVGTDLLNSSLTSSDDDISLDVGRDVLGCTLLNDDGDNTITIGRNLRGTLQSGSGDYTITIGGSVLNGTQILEGDTTILTITGNMDGKVVCDDLDLQVGGNVGKNARILVNEIVDLGDAGTVGFSVGGSFAGVLNALDFDANSSAAAGENHTLVGGPVTATGRFNIGDIASTSATDTYTFGGAFLGQLNIGGNLDVDLSFAANVKRVIIGGAVLDTISVGGRLTYLASAGLFVPTTPGVDGDFEDGNGTVTGNLDTVSGFVTVVPQA